MVKNFKLSSKFDYHWSVLVVFCGILEMEDLKREDEQKSTTNLQEQDLKQQQTNSNLKRKRGRPLGSVNKKNKLNENSISNLTPIRLNKSNDKLDQSTLDKNKLEHLSPIIHLNSSINNHHQTNQAANLTQLNLSNKSSQTSLHKSPSCNSTLIRLPLINSPLNRSSVANSSFSSPNSQELNIRQPHLNLPRASLIASNFYQQAFDKLDSFNNLVNNQANKLNELKNRLDLIEREKSIENDWSTNQSVKQHEISCLLDVDKLNKYNYLNWSQSVLSQLKKSNFDIFIKYKPKLNNSEAIKLDEEIKKAILFSITFHAKETIDLYHYQYAKQLWILIKQLFYDDYVKRKMLNLNFITREDLKSLDEMKEHIAKFRTAALELDAINFKFNDKILIQLFLNTLIKQLASFHCTIKNSINETQISFKNFLDYAEAQANCEEPINLDEYL